MPAIISQMRLLVVRRAGLHAKHNQVEGIAVVEVVVTANLARCIPLFVQTVVMKPRYLSSHVATSQSTVVIAISRRNRGVVATEDRAGNCHE
jgi:hypothetical protein